MGNLSVEQKIQAALKGIPKDKLPEIYDLIHYFKKGVVIPGNPTVYAP